MLEIRLAQETERESAANIAVEAFVPLKPILPNGGWQEMSGRVHEVTINKQYGPLLLALLDGELVGSVIYNGPGEPENNVFPPDWAYFRALAVLPAFTRNGIGRALTGQCIRRAKAEAAQQIALYTADANTGARNLYLDMGFKQYGEKLKFFGVSYSKYVLDV
jgi:ribosomal protein S18 acetylase RimI-like enzyme